MCLENTTLFFFLYIDLARNQRRGSEPGLNVDTGIILKGRLHVETFASGILGSAVIPWV